MKNLRRHLLTGLAVAVAGFSAACADAPIAPARSTGPQDALVAAAKGGNNNGKAKGRQDTETLDLTKFVDTLSRLSGKVAGERWVTPLATSQYASATIDSAGGWVELAATGTYLYVPQGTVSVPTTFSIKAMAGKIVSFDFQPAGSVFKTPVVLVQDKSLLVNTPLKALLSAVGATQQLAYVPNEATFDQTLLTATGQELRPSLLDSANQYLAYPIYHFSGYIVSWGFRARDDD